MGWFHGAPGALGGPDGLVRPHRAHRTTGGRSGGGAVLVLGPSPLYHRGDAGGGRRHVGGLATANAAHPDPSPPSPPRKLESVNIGRKCIGVRRLATTI